MMGGQGRIWGMSAGKMGYWFAGDLDRFSRSRYIAIHTGSSIKPTFTTANDKEVYELIFKLWNQAKENPNMSEGDKSSMMESESESMRDSNKMKIEE